MREKILFVATVDRGHILKFHLPYLKYFKEKGYEIHVACAGDADIPYCDKKHELPFERSPFKFANFIAYKKLKNIIDENSYSLIHCHTPVGGVVGRLASRDSRKKGTNVLYTGHGFHFYKGASLINWALYYPIEKWLSSYTDCLITINEEDYQNAIKSCKANSIKKVSGVGVNLNKFSAPTVVEKEELRKKYNYNEKDFILMYTAELNYNKHQDLLIKTVNSLKYTVPNIKLLLAGEGSLLENYKEQVKKLELDDKVEFLGFRDDISSLLKLSDLAVSASRREGLPVNVMEAMASGLPLVVTNCRGNRDLVSDGENGYIVGIDDVEDFVTAIEKIYKSEELRRKFGEKSLELIKEYSLENVSKEMDEIYINYLK